MQKVGYSAVGLGDRIIVEADYAQVTRPELVDLFLYTPGARYGFVESTAAHQNYGGDYRKEYLIEWLTRHTGEDAQFIRDHLSFGINHQGKGRVTFALKEPERLDEIDPTRFRAYLIQVQERKWLPDVWHVEEVPIHTAQDSQ